MGAIFLLLLVSGGLHADPIPDNPAEISVPQETRKISLSLKEADLYDVLKMFSEKGGWNLVMGEKVSGKVSLELHDVRIEEALAAVMNVGGYAIEQKGDLLFVRSKEKVAGPSFPQTVEHRTFRIHYASVEETSEVIKKYLSPHGSLTIHKSSNTLFIEDLPDVLAKIESILQDLDRPPTQVLIEAKIMEVRLTDDLSFGVDWKKVFTERKTTGTLQTSGFSRSQGGGPGFFFSLATPDVNIFLDALQQKGILNTLATPKILALNHKPAQIVIGGRLGYRVTATTNQVTTESVEFLDIGTQLRFTPHIADHGNILMEIHPEISDGVVTEGLPSKTTTEVTTTLLAKDGETVLIGGLIRERNEGIDTQVPGLGGIPFLGSLFKRNEDKSSKTEIIVLITPHLNPTEEKQ
ncbi:MAG: hypothetical protein HY760_09240 [Nitrospirae bacterium]|nr:hypothetical protein [Nitrospirota bacterium]